MWHPLSQQVGLRRRVRAPGIWLAVCVAASAVPGLTAGPASAAGPESLEDFLDPEARKHYAQGEVRYRDEWIPVGDLHEKMQELDEAMAPVLETGREVRRQLYEVDREMTELRNEQRSKRFPLFRERTELRREKAEYEAVLRRRPPKPPRLEPEPQAPTRRAFGGETEKDYKRRVREWRKEREGVRRENERRKEEYQEKKKDLEKAKEEARKEIEKLDAEIAELEKQIAAINEEYAQKTAPFEQKRDTARKELQDLRAEASVLLRRRQMMEEALDAAPPEVIWKAGLVAWGGSYRPLAELREEYERTKEEIAQVRQDLQAAAEQAGREFPSDWRHPRQDKMDELKALLERVETALGE